MEHKGLPVHGYKPQSEDSVAMVNYGKEVEELVLRWLDTLGEYSQYDQRMVALARTNMQTGFMWAARSVFQPSRISLPADRGSRDVPPLGT